MRVVSPDLIQIIVLAGYTKALLRVDCARVRPLVLAKEDLLELDHPRICEQERCITSGHKRGRRDSRMAVLDKEIYVGLADFRASKPFHVRSKWLGSSNYTTAMHSPDCPQTATPWLDVERFRTPASGPQSAARGSPSGLPARCGLHIFGLDSVNRQQERACPLSSIHLVT